jgi:hypothetical protein
MERLVLPCEGLSSPGGKEWLSRIRSAARAAQDRHMLAQSEPAQPPLLRPESPPTRVSPSQLSPDTLSRLRMRACEYRERAEAEDASQWWVARAAALSSEATADCHRLLSRAAEFHSSGETNFMEGALPRFRRELGLSGDPRLLLQGVTADTTRVLHAFLEHHRSINTSQASLSSTTDSASKEHGPSE